MSNEVWYRKWRPQAFAEVSGQDHVVRTLKNAVAQGRVAHAYLLCGPRGTGKTTMARLLAKAVNCAAPAEGEPCNRCPSCLAVNEGRALDLVEMDAASNRGIDDIRSLRDRVGYHPSGGHYRVYLIDEVHELTAQAFDALLKTLEEPPPHIIFVLATTDAHRVPATIISRCQRFDLTRVRHADIVRRLDQIARHEAVQIEPAALSLVARAAAGGLRDAVNLLEQLVASFGPDVTAEQARAGLGMTGEERARELAVCAAAGDFAGGLTAIATALDEGVEGRQLHRAVLGQLRALLLVTAGAGGGLEGLSAEAMEELGRTAGSLDARRILQALRAFSAVDFRGESQAALPLELALAEVTLVDGMTVGAVRATPAGAAPTTAPQRPPSAERRQPPGTAASARGGSSAPMPEARPPVESAPEPVHATAPELAQAQGRFRAIYQAMQVLSRKDAGVLNSGCDVIAINDRVITFGFQYAYMVDKLAKGTDAHRHLSRAVEQVFGVALDVSCEHRAGVVDRLKASPARTSHLLEEAKALGGTVLDSSI